VSASQLVAGVEAKKSTPYVSSKVNVRNLDLSTPSSLEVLETYQAEDWDIVFFTGTTTSYSMLHLVAQMAKNREWPLVGIVTDSDLNCNWTAVRNLRLMLHSCDTTIMSTHNESSVILPVTELSSNVISAICEGLTNPCIRRPLRGMLKRGQLARVSSARSNSNIEEAVLKALRPILPLAGITENNEVFLALSCPTIDRKILSHATRWISKALAPANIVICTNSKECIAKWNVFLLITRVAFPYLSPSSRNLCLDIDDLEPESCFENESRLTLELDQIESDDISHCLT